jgi:hypothetical protein
MLKCLTLDQPSISALYPRHLAVWRRFGFQRQGHPTPAYPGLSLGDCAPPAREVLVDMLVGETVRSSPSQ